MRIRMPAMSATSGESLVNVTTVSCDTVSSRTPSGGAHRLLTQQAGGWIHA